jgi:two-component system, response regulator, stage 0 sporulation protein F
MVVTRESVRSVSPHPHRAPGTPARVLVADDDTEMRRLVCDTLRKDGHQVVEEPDGGRLLVRVASLYHPTETVEPVDLIVSDIRMPVCTGLDILKGMRDAHWATPVVLMTAFADDEVARRASLLGATLFNKPFQMSELRETVKALLAA